jgi:hypothetical protein
MAFSAPLSHVVLVITAAALFYVALADFKRFKIRNELILVRKHFGSKNLASPKSSRSSTHFSRRSEVNE